MVKADSGPAMGGVANRAILWQPGGKMIRITRPIVILQMARNTFLRCSRIDPILVAVYTGQRRVTAG